MNKKLLHFLIAAGIVVILSVIVTVLILSNKKESSLMDGEPQGTPLISADESTLTSVKVENTQDSFTAVLTDSSDSNGKKTQVLRLQGYEDVPAVTDSFDKLLLRSTHFNATRKLSDSEADSSYDYGFDAPQAKFTSTFQDGTQKTILLGNSVPDGSSLYAKLEGDSSVYIISFTYLDTFSKAKDDYFSKTIIPVYSDDDTLTMQSIELGGTLRSEPITITNYHDATSAQLYEISSPLSALTLDDKVEDILSSLSSGLDAVSIDAVNPTPAQLTEYGLDTPYSTIRFRFQGSEQYLRIGREQDEEGFVHVMVNENPLIYKIAASMLPYRDYQLSDILSTRLFTGNITQISHIILTANGGKTYDFTVDNSQSQAAYVLNGTQIDSDQGATFYSNLLLLSRQEISEKTPSSASPYFSCTLQFSDTSREATKWEVYKESDDEYLFMTGGKTTARVYSSTMEQLSSDLEKLANGQAIEAMY